MRLYHDDMVKLKQMFGHRAKFDAAELRLYSQDISNPPAPVKMLIKQRPEAVVLPKDLEELVDLVRYANDRAVPLVPRGGGTAGYGGAMPVKGGIVVDLSEMADTLTLSKDGKYATVAPGMTFLEAEARLNAQGKALRIMPTSAPAATFAGWLAQGGAGLGSLQYGWVDDVVASAKVVLPNGDVRTFSDTELDVIADMEGTTGIIAEITLQIRDDDRLVPFLATFKELEPLQAALDRLVADQRLWTIMVHNPEFSELRQEALGTRTIPKGQFSLLMAAEEDHADKDAIKAIVEDAGGKLQADDKAADEWGLRFALFAAKRLGPSMVPGEAVVPTKKVGLSASRIRRAVKSETLLMEGIVVGDDTVWFTYALDDERRKEYPAAFGAAVAVLDAAKGVGGRTLGTGVYLSNERGNVFSDDRLDRVRSFRRAVDTAGIMNPGKVFGAPLRVKPDWAPGPDLAGALAPGNPVLKAVHGSSFVKYRREETGRKAYTRGISAALGTGAAGRFGETWAWDLIAADVDRNIRWSSACARAFRSMAASPMGWVLWAKDHVLGTATFTPHQWAMLHGEGLASGADLASELRIPYSRILIDLKEHLRDQGFRPLPTQRKVAASVAEHHNVFGAPHEERAAWAKDLDLPEKGATLLFVDDLLSYKRPEEAQDLVTLLAAGGVTPAYLGAEERSSCAGLIHAGLKKDAIETIKHNIEAVKKAGAKEIVTPDVYAYRAFKDDYPRLAESLGLEWNVKVRHAAEVLAELVDKGKLEVDASVDGTVAVHDVAALLAAGVDADAVHTLVGAVGAETTELPHHGRRTRDLGVSGLVPESFPEVCAKEAEALLVEAQGADADILVTADPASAHLLQEAAGAIERDTPTPASIIGLLAGRVATATKEAEGDEGAEAGDEAEGEASGDEGAGKDDAEGDEGAEKAEATAQE